MMIRAYRIRGHLKANLDPLGLVEKNEHSELKPETYGFTPEAVSYTHLTLPTTPYV